MTHSLLSLFRSAGLLTHLDDAEAMERVVALQEDLGAGEVEAPFLLMAVLDAEYGFDTADEEATVSQRCVSDGVLVFNEYHETEASALLPRLRALLDASGATWRVPEAVDGGLPWELADDLAQALRAGGVSVQGIGCDTWEALLFRSTLPPELVDAMRHEAPAEPQASQVRRPWWRWWG